tara:strand:- start:365 stop:592 length:228 start_codon:yes stop_codon:yes gene_type:complete
MERKEAYRLFFLVKGHIDTDDSTAFSSADGYFKRLWIAGANGAPLYEYQEGFEEAWQKRLNRDQVLLNIQIEKLA